MGNYRDLRDWLKRVEEIGEVKVIDEEVDWNEELTAITYMAAKKKEALPCSLKISKVIQKDTESSSTSWVRASGGSH